LLHLSLDWWFNCILHAIGPINKLEWLINLGQITTYLFVVWLKFKLLTCDLKIGTLPTWG